MSSLLMMAAILWIGGVVGDVGVGSWGGDKMKFNDVPLARDSLRQVLVSPGPMLHNCGTRTPPQKGAVYIVSVELDSVLWPSIA